MRDAHGKMPYAANTSSACPGASQLRPLFMLQVHGAAAFQPMSLHASLPWRDDTGTLSCFVKVTVSIDINPLFQGQVWARDLGQGLRRNCVAIGYFSKIVHHLNVYAGDCHESVEIQHKVWGMLGSWLVSCMFYVTKTRCNLQDIAEIKRLGE
jgi:hypothetical protein